MVGIYGNQNNYGWGNYSGPTVGLAYVDNYLNGTYSNNGWFQPLSNGNAAWVPIGGASLEQLTSAMPQPPQQPVYPQYQYPPQPVYPQYPPQQPVYFQPPPPPPMPYYPPVQQPQQSAVFAPAQYTFRLPLSRILAGMGVNPQQLGSGFDFSGFASMISSFMNQLPQPTRLPAPDTTPHPIPPILLPAPMTTPQPIPLPIPLPAPIAITDPITVTPPTTTYSLPIELTKAKQVAKLADTNHDNLLTRTEINQYTSHATGYDQFVGTVLGTNFTHIASTQQFLRFNVITQRYELPESNSGLPINKPQAIVIETPDTQGGVFVYNTPQVADGITLNPEDYVDPDNPPTAYGGYITGYSIWNYQRSDLDRLAGQDLEADSISQDDIDWSSPNYVANVFASPVYV